MTEALFVSFLLAHLVICAVYFLLALLPLSRQESFCRLIIALTVPVFGILALVFSDIFKGKEEALGIIDRSTNVSGYKYIKTVDREKEKDTVPLEEVLLIDDYETKRRILLDIFKASPDRYVRELKLAIADPDTETSHYASAALMEIDRKYTNSLHALSKHTAENPGDRDAARDYAELLYRYVKSGIPDELSLRRYQDEFITAAQRLLDQGDNAVMPELYSGLAITVFERGDPERAAGIASGLIDLFPDSELAYFTEMRIFYDSGMVDQFKTTLERLKSSPVILSKEGLSKLRFFIGGGAAS